MSDVAPSGQQWEISADGHRAVVVEVGGGVRRYDVDDRPVLDGYPRSERMVGGAGAVLAPWPNRVGDGSYTFAGARQQLALTEPATRTAIHGLLRWVPWRVVEHETDAVTVTATVHPQPGYPHTVVVRTRWSVGPAGLRADHTAEHLGDGAAPFGLGAHPYLQLADSPEPTWSLRVPAATVLDTDDRGLPVGRRPVAGDPADLRAGAVLAGTVLDTAWTDLERDADGLARTTVSAGGASVQLWQDAAFGWVQVFTADTLPPPRRRRSWAVEPMTCPPDALRTGTDLLSLRAGSPWHGSWGVRVRR